ncbi:MAG: matrixin family metalloprotease [Candidatus Diapherotrites archaeon]
MNKRIFLPVFIGLLLLAPMAFALPQEKEPVEKITIIHYKKGFEKSQPPSAKATPSSCTKYLGKDLKWKTLPINLLINPVNNYGLSEEFVSQAVWNAALEWDKWTATTLFGSYSIDVSANWDDKVPDNRNEFSFGNYPQNGVIAVTNIWGYFSGNKKQIVEFDVLFDTDFEWGDATTNKTVMDLQNIATHEIGHGLGLADLYSTSCYSQTMYGYSTEGETEKRTLDAGDIKGITTLYGAT